MPRVLSDPDADAAHRLVLDGLDSDGLVTLFGRCTVDYEGRASSTLGPGDRHVMCKPDGTVLVHTDAGHQPVNWQPPGSEQFVAVEDGELHLRSERTTPEEHLHVAFSSLDHAAVFQVTDEEELSLEGTEEDLRGRILDTPALVEAGFQPLATERETPAGAVDIYGEDDEGRTVVVELKRRRVGPDAVGQLSRYVEALERDLPEGTELRGILVAPSVTDRARELLAEKGLEFVALEP
ncbi:endonuclease NucS [Natronomonas sp. EA1]|uniref:endonuclease NucS n=1 Tax=Natronomonas sp. EA1 TaxID=3421655 RepID=UPI003EB81353